MSLSKPLVGLAVSYLQQLYLHPVRTRSLTSAVVGTAGSVASQLIAGERVNTDTVLSFGLYGLLFGGSIPHFFYIFLERVFPHEAVAFPLAKHLIFERLIFAPLYQAFSLYTLARFEGKTHDASVKQLLMIYWPVLQANWKWLTLTQLFNFAFVPPVLRVLFGNLVGFFWAMFLARKRRQQSEKKD